MHNFYHHHHQLMTMVARGGNTRRSNLIRRSVKVPNGLKTNSLRYFYLKLTTTLSHLSAAISLGRTQKIVASLGHGHLWDREGRCTFLPSALFRMRSLAFQNTIGRPNPTATAWDLQRLGCEVWLTFIKTSINITINITKKERRYAEKRASSKTLQKSGWGIQPETSRVRSHIMTPAPIRRTEPLATIW